MAPTHPISTRMTPSTDIVFRAPDAMDAGAVRKLIARSGTLDQNSFYCNILQCSHFAQTCVVAECGDEVLGWTSGYVPPQQPDTYFVWQICVAPQARSTGLARRMIRWALGRPALRDVSQIECTITADNRGSWAMFGALARDLAAPVASAPHLLRDTHFLGSHASEDKVTIGPFGIAPAQAA